MREEGKMDGSTLETQPPSADVGPKPTPSAWTRTPPEDNENFWIGWDEDLCFPEIWLGTVYHLAKTGHKHYAHLDPDKFTLWQRLVAPENTRASPPTPVDGAQ